MVQVGFLTTTSLDGHWQKKYQDNYLPFKPIETGEVSGPVYPSLYSFAQEIALLDSTQPISDWID